MCFSDLELRETIFMADFVSNESEFEGIVNGTDDLPCLTPVFFEAEILDG